MIRTNPKNVVRTAVVSPPRNGVVSTTAPWTHAVTFVRPTKKLGASTMYAISDPRARRPSESIAPPPTGRASVSMSSCFDDDELLTRLCQPEIAPHAIATNRIGQIGPRIPWGSNKNGPAGIWTLIGAGAFGNVSPRKLAPQNGVLRAPNRIQRDAADAG